MNEQLVVKNFGPIKDATVDFKRVTVFIGPTGGGKSTLAKLAAIFGEGGPFVDNVDLGGILEKYGIDNYRENEYFIKLSSQKGKNVQILADIITYDDDTVAAIENYNDSDAGVISKDDLMPDIQSFLDTLPTSDATNTVDKIRSLLKQYFRQAYLKGLFESTLYTHYVPAERLIVSTLNHSWPSLIQAKVDLPKPLLDFVKAYLKAGPIIDTLTIPFLEVEYEHINDRGYVNLGNQRSLPINETASGIQSVTPLLVLLEHLSRNTEQAQSFIIEEPELNLYPTAQQGLLNWLVEKCTKGENDLTITTHSPYLLAHFNLLLYAYQVAENHPDRADDVAKIVPRESWINPKEFAAYHVEGQQENGVRSIINPETGLISYNGLDATATAETSEFEKLLDINAGLEVE
ncbi:AAA family ATPase [Hymenobacter daeguensis]